MDEELVDLVFNNDGVFVSDSGLSYEFKQGEVITLPIRFKHQALAYGAVLVDKLSQKDNVAQIKPALSRIDIIKNVMRKLTPAELGTGGKPSIALLKAKTGYDDINADERDALWNSLS